MSTYIKNRIKNVQIIVSIMSDGTTIIVNHFSKVELMQETVRHFGIACTQIDTN